jgi:hypothetical protein
MVSTCWRIAVVVTSLTFLLAGCDPVPVASRLGVLRPPEGDLTIVYMGCRDELLNEVALIDSKGELGDADDVVLWLIKSADGSDLQEFRLGQTPSGFVEEVAFSGNLPAETSLTAQIRTLGGLTTATAFEPASLTAGTVTTVDGALPRDDFEREAAASCGGP